MVAQLNAKPSVLQFFSEGAPSYGRNVLRWMASAKRPTARQKRIDVIVETSAQREKVP
jgi:uncharacterized protein YdeI (YjbR/CyaY-like superfamily)